MLRAIAARRPRLQVEEGGTTSGLYVVRVTPRSTASRLGIQCGDFILYINDQRIDEDGMAAWNTFQTTLNADRTAGRATRLTLGRTEGSAAICELVRRSDAELPNAGAVPAAEPQGEVHPATVEPVVAGIPLGGPAGGPQGAAPPVETLVVGIPLGGPAGGPQGAPAGGTPPGVAPPGGAPPGGHPPAQAPVEEGPFHGAPVQGVPLEEEEDPEAPQEGRDWVNV